LKSFRPPFSKGGAGSGRVAPHTPFLFDNFFFAAPSDKEKVALDFYQITRLHICSLFKSGAPNPDFLHSPS
jgi:hypothetical protein